jgi:hypothetical protein
MIELSLNGGVTLQCDVCRRQVHDAGLAIVMRGPGASAVFVHKAPCHKAAERFLCSGTDGWMELVDFLADLPAAVGVDDQADELIQGHKPTRLLRRIAEVAEAAYRRGFQQGHDVCRRGDRLAIDLEAWRFGIPLDQAPSPTGDRPTTAVERLDIQHHELVAELLMGAGPRDKQARGHGGRRGSR